MRVFLQIVIWLGLTVLFSLVIIELQGAGLAIALVIAVILVIIHALYTEQVEELKTEIGRLEARLQDVEEKAHDE